MPRSRKKLYFRIERDDPRSFIKESSARSLLRRAEHELKLLFEKFPETAHIGRKIIFISREIIAAPQLQITVSL